MRYAVRFPHIPRSDVATEEIDGHHWLWRCLDEPGHVGPREKRTLFESAEEARAWARQGLCVVEEVPDVTDVPPPGARILEESHDLDEFEEPEA